MCGFDYHVSIGATNNDDGMRSAHGGQEVEIDSDNSGIFPIPKAKAGVLPSIVDQRMRTHTNT